MNIIHRIYLLVFMLACSLSAFCQSKPALNSLVNSINKKREELPVEKLFLQLDKPNYVENDTIWFKAYLFNADYLTPSIRSGLLYVELDDNNNKCLKRIMIPMVTGLNWGNIAINKDDIPEGNYILRAYTNWMRNFGEDYIFKKQISIASATEQSRLVTATFKQSKQGDKDNIRANILISWLNDQPIRLKDMQLRVMDGRHTIIKANTSTGVDGKMNINFDLSTNTGNKNLSISVKDVTKGTDVSTPLIIPVIINRPENIDLQFMAEGGKLIAGLSSKIGFKAINENGRGTDVSGKIYNSKQQEVATFRSTYKGMGIFDLKPEAGEVYTAKLDLPAGNTKSYALPMADPSGTALSAINKGDTLQVKIFTPNSLNTGYYLIGQSRGVICFAARINKSSISTFAVPKKLFPTGIAHFTLLNAKDQPLNERIVYIDHHDNLDINIATNKITYLPHDSIALNIKVTDSTGKPVRGSFSLAVTDDSQVKTDSLGSNIVNNLLFTSDLKGTVEDPAYYFEHNDDERISELDNLMLTQGWVGYDWKQLANDTLKPTYPAETEFAIKGSITNIFNKPVAGAKVELLSKKPAFATDTVTDKSGHFTFKGFFPVDTVAFIIEAKNKHDKNINVGINIDEFIPPIFTQDFERPIPWYVNSDTSLLRNLNNTIIKQQAEIKLTGTHVLKEVVIKAKKVIKGSHNLNGPGEYDEALDEKDMEKAGKMTLGEILQQKISGYHDNPEGITLQMNLLILIIDGMNVEFFFSPTHRSFQTDALERYDFLRTYLDNITAEDIIGIEAMYNYSKYIRYDFQFYPKPTERNGDPGYAYIEVTTRSGHGYLVHTTPGVYEYKPLAFSLPKQFYRPKYKLNSSNTLLPDLRSTVHWEPNIMTDTAGKATVSFYSADKPAGYTIIMEGTDMNGQLGYIRKKLTVK
jgi:hypothetical protein